jgi:hypothetical protein
MFDNKINLALHFINILLILFSTHFLSDQSFTIPNLRLFLLSVFGSKNRNLRQCKLRPRQAVYHEKRPPEVRLCAELQSNRSSKQAAEKEQRQKNHRRSDARNKKSEAEREATDTFGNAER